MSYQDLAEAILALPAGDGRHCRVVAVNGYSGSGKGFFAARLAAVLGTQPLNTDDLVRGWDGLAESIDLLLDRVLRPAAHGLTGRWRRYDWDQLALAGWVEVPPRPVLVVEGCGVGVRRTAPLPVLPGVGGRASRGPLPPAGPPGRLGHVPAVGGHVGPTGERRSAPGNRSPSARTCSWTTPRRRLRMTQAGSSPGDPVPGSACLQGQRRIGAPFGE